MKHQLKQLIPSQTCLDCDICCRYPDKQSHMAPVFSLEEKSKAIELGIPKRFFSPPQANRGFQISPIIGEGCFRCPASGNHLYY